jgi:hypothetical protein
VVPGAGLLPKDEHLFIVRIRILANARQNWSAP